MRPSSCLCLAALAAVLVPSPAAQTLEAGAHAVGFKVLEAQTTTDSIPVYFWYPAREATGSAMPYGDYLVLTQVHKRRSFGPATPADWEAAADLPRGISRAAFDLLLTDDRWQAITQRTTAARHEAEPALGSFPLVLGGLNGAQSAAMLAEHLASHGYVVASGPMPSDIGRQQRAAPLQAVENLSEILDVVFAEAARQSGVDTSRVGLVGVNFDGYTVLDTQMRTGRAEAVLTLDGREGKAGGASIRQSLPHYDPERLRVPYLAFSMDVADPGLRPDRTFFDSLPQAEVVVLDGVEHFHYIGDLLAWPHLRAEVEPVYAGLYDRVLGFLDAHVRNAHE